MEKVHKLRNPRLKHSFKQTYTFSRTVEPSKYNVYKEQPKLLHTLSAERNINYTSEHECPKLYVPPFSMSKLTISTPVCDGATPT